jgi:hypothetical protein
MLNCRAEIVEILVATEALSKCRASLFYIGRGFIPSLSASGLHPDIWDNFKAEVEVPADGGNGMIVTQGGRFGG